MDEEYRTAEGSSSEGGGTRDLLSMKYFEMRSDSEIAEKLGIGKNSVRQYLSAARRKRKEELIRGGWYG
ncbi:MAG: sigma factor-like helix-turn-helix DNA-binding protein [Clostridia bacterium]|nr:sigma factor-like helix-turn-helix DNA-binding protein [Clostridia bacterium]